MAVTKGTTKKVVKILKEIENGIAISKACEKHDLSRNAFYKWVHLEPENATTLYDIIDSRTVDVEDALYEKAIKGDTTAQIFWLKNRSSKRWKDRQQHDVEFKGNLTVEVSDEKAKDGLNDVIGETDS